MFKAVLLGQWHSLSDVKLEEALYVRIDFIEFCGLNLTDDVPDESTLCRFRNRLIKADRLTQLLSIINDQLQKHGLMVSKAQGAVLDATIITSAARPNKILDLQTDSQGEEIKYEDGSQPGQNYVEVTSADPDAAWLKKGKKCHYGYRSYWVVDAEDGYVRGIHTAPANESEMTHFTQAVDSADMEITRVYADKGSSSKANREWLKARQIKSGIQHRAVKNKPLTDRQKLANKLISKKRYIVEQCFGTGKRLFGMARSRYFTTVKVNGQMLMKSICMNLTKAANKILDIQPCLGLVRLN
jgi:IS5 family transposase